MVTNKHVRVIFVLCVSVLLLCAGLLTRAFVVLVAPMASQTSAHSARYVSVFGFVHLSNGSPAVNRQVTAAFKPRLHEIGGEAPWAQVNGDGAFALNRGLLATEKYILRVSGVPEDLHLKVGRRLYTVLYLRMGVGTVKESSPFATPAHSTVVFGVVTLPDGRAPMSLPDFVAVKSSRVSKHAKRVEASTSVGKSGAFVLPHSLSSGMYTVIVTDKTGSCVARTSFVVPRPHRPYMVLILKAATGSMCGYVLDATGHPVVKGKVVLSNELRDLVYGATTGKDGHYLINHILSGQYIVEAASNPANQAGLMVMMGVVAIKGGQLKKDFTVWGASSFSSKRPRTVPAMKAAHGSVYGRVLDDAGNPIVRGIVELLGLPQPHGLAYRTITDMGGHYVIKHVLPGQYIANVSSNPMDTDLANLESMMEVVVIKDGKLKKDFKLRKATRLIH